MFRIRQWIKMLLQNVLLPVVSGGTAENRYSRGGF